MNFIPHINLINQSNYDTSISAERLSACKKAYATRRIDNSAVKTLIQGDVQPRPGDLVLARVDKLGHHARIELTHGRRAPLFVGDEIIVCYGNRYAPDQFEAKVPQNLDSCHLVAAGGIAAQSLSRHNATKTATLIQPLGLLGDADGKVLNLADWALTCVEMKRPRPFIVTVIGTSMNAGKTTSAAYLIKGLAHSGMKVGAAKVTGTGAGCDRWLMMDAGATEVVDFTDAGFASTYCASLDQLELIYKRLLNHLCTKGVDAVVLEIADGLFQQETAALINSPVLRNHVDAILFAAGDAMGANGGVEWLRKRNLPVVGISGCISASPLASREAQEATGLKVFGLDELASPDIAVELFDLCSDTWATAAVKAS